VKTVVIDVDIIESIVVDLSSSEDDIKEESVQVRCSVPLLIPLMRLIFIPADSYMTPFIARS
jgi:hypothetical protein